MALHLRMKQTFRLKSINQSALTSSVWEKYPFEADKKLAVKHSQVQMHGNVDKKMVSTRHMSSSIPHQVLLQNRRSIVSMCTQGPKFPAVNNNSCHALHTKLASQALMQLPRNMFKHLQHREKDYEVKCDDIASDAGVLFGLYDYSRKYVKPYTYTADDICIVKSDLPGDKQNRSLNAFDFDDLSQIVTNVLQDECKQELVKKHEELKNLGSPYGSSCIIDLTDMVSFQQGNINALLADLKHYLFLNEGESLLEVNDSEELKTYTLKHTSMNEYSNHTLLFSSKVSNSNDQIPCNDPQRRPNMDQLTVVQNIFVEAAPKIFVDKHDYSLYTKDVVLENNYISKPKTTVGLSAYVWQVAKLRFSAHIAFANVRMSVIRASAHEEEGCVRIHWRLSGIPQTRALAFWKFMPWNYSQSLNTESEWSDGISTLYVNDAGLVYKHQVDKVIKDNQTETVKGKSLVEKLTLASQPGLAASSNQT